MPKILLIEDNELNYDMLSKRLTHKGFQIVIAVDGQQGIASAQEEIPDLILMDVNLPIIDGWEATRQIKALPTTQHIPIIALTAHAMVGDEQKSVEAGCDDYAIKPVDLPQLLVKIHVWLDGKVCL
ncbi:MAG: response regulator [Candidatus Tectomicrobia bacterium]